MVIKRKLKTLTLLTNISVSSKWRPNILGASPGIGSILMQTSWPLRAVSMFLWFISMDVTTPSSTNCEIIKRKRKESENEPDE